MISVTMGHDTFHEEKDGLFQAGMVCSDYLQDDDTGARHKGQNCHTRYIGSEHFASFATTATKSRVNFLETLLPPNTERLLAGDAIF